ncbi:hypothetical protein T08_7887 [Trichinella sp. T8]|nr:hypothetical protein T08_7887 [Trichinella sp. T8]
MDFQMPLLPTVENTQPKGQKLANELENELDVRKLKKHKHLGSQNIRFLKYHLTLIQTAVYIKGNLIMTCELAVGSSSSSSSSRTLCWKKRDFGWQLDVYGWKACLPHHRRWLFPITETLSTYWHCFPRAAISFAAAFVLSPVDL